MRESGSQEIRNLKANLIHGVRGTIHKTAAVSSAFALSFPDFLLSRFKFLFISFLFLAAALCPARADKHSDADSTLVIFNTRDPDSPALAKYYADKRNIPPENLVGLDCPLTEE